MKLEWMGRNRELIRMLMKYVNLFSQNDIKYSSDDSGVSLSAQQWQTLECIIEYEEENQNMVFMANQLGMPKSTFSKHVKVLVKDGLVERYQQADNRKNIILKPSDNGRVYYQIRSRIIFDHAWKEPFAILEKLSDEQMETVVMFISKMVADLEPENNVVRELFKLQ